MNQSSIDILFEKLWDTPKDKWEWNAILKDIKEIHKNEIMKAAYDNMGNNFDPNMGRAELYYNSKYK
jgi:hypothetical protein